MKILLNSLDLKKELEKNDSLGFVPTMGSIHLGHQYLIKRSMRENSKTIVSIFINPTQFNHLKDFKTYPRNINKDLGILKNLRVDFVFIPKTKDIYNFKRKKKISLKKKDQIMCAKYRKGHFEGVLDVMDRLTKLIKPKKIFMGEKDLQQFILVKRFLEKRYNTKIIKCKTIRDKNQIALSSRNKILSSNSLRLISNFINEIKKIKKNLTKQSNINNYLNSKTLELKKKYKIKIEYLELRNKYNLKKTKKTKNSKIFIAFYKNNVRLIDNL